MNINQISVQDIIRWYRAGMADYAPGHEVEPPAPTTDELLEFDGFIIEPDGSVMRHGFVEIAKQVNQLIAARHGGAANSA